MPPRTLMGWSFLAYLGFVVVTLPVGNNVLMWLWPGLVYLALMKADLSIAGVYSITYLLGAGVVLGTSAGVRRLFPRLPTRWLPLLAVLVLSSLPAVGVLLYFVGRLYGLAYVG